MKRRRTKNSVAVYRRQNVQGLMKIKPLAYASLVRKSSGVRPLTYIWVFARKRNEHGQIRCYKARFVAKGFKHELFVDFIDTYSPVVKQ